MGSSQSYPGLTEDLLEDYKTLTYLKRGEILYLMKKFYSINGEQLTANYHHRFTKAQILNKFDILKNNPFQDRLFRVFSSQKDDCFSFEDLLDLCSAMSPECPVDVKAAWAFQVFDLDEDHQVSSNDICQILDRLTANSLGKGDKMKIAHIILNEINLDNTGSMGLAEFKLMMSRIPEFESSFYFRL